MIRLPNVTGKWRFSLKGMNLENTDDRFEREVTPEIAPPNDWRPACYHSNYKSNGGGCFGVENGVSDVCPDCPYRLQGEARK